jgi:hypothetical protein
MSYLMAYLGVVLIVMSLCRVELLVVAVAVRMLQLP